MTRSLAALIVLCACSKDSSSSAGSAAAKPTEKATPATDAFEKAVGEATYNLQELATTLLTMDETLKSGAEMGCGQIRSMVAVEKSWQDAVNGLDAKAPAMGACHDALVKDTAALTSLWSQVTADEPCQPVADWYTKNSAAQRKAFCDIAIAMRQCNQDGFAAGATEGFPEVDSTCK